MLHFHCYFDVQILLSHSIHFLILKRFLIGRYNFLTFLRLSRLHAIAVIVMRHFQCMLLEDERKPQRREEWKSSLKWKKDKKQLWKDTLWEFEETLYEPFASIVWATFDVLVFLRKLKICGRYTSWNYKEVTIRLPIIFITKTSTFNGESPFKVFACDKSILYEFFIMQMANM